jgi:hypothetical protein
VAGVLDREMSAAGAVNVIVAGVGGVRHGISYRADGPTARWLVRLDGW